MAEEKATNNNVSVHKGWLIGVAAAVIVFLGAAFVFGAAVGRFHSVNYGARGSMSRMMGFEGERTYGGYMRSNQDVVRGVVTTVNGSSFTVAGNGATNTVTTDSSTQWRGANSVKPNDTVVVSGSLSNNTFTATDIVVNP